MMKNYSFIKVILCDLVRFILKLIAWSDRPEFKEPIPKKSNTRKRWVREKDWELEYAVAILEEFKLGLVGK